MDCLVNKYDKLQLTDAGKFQTTISPPANHVTPTNQLPVYSVPPAL
jgi:hypothetical protein